MEGWYVRHGLSGEGERHGSPFYKFSGPCLRQRLGFDVKGHRARKAVPANGDVNFVKFCSPNWVESGCSGALSNLRSEGRRISPRTGRREYGRAVRRPEIRAAHGRPTEATPNRHRILPFWDTDTHRWALLSCARRYGRSGERGLTTAVHARRKRPIWYAGRQRYPVVAFSGCGQSKWPLSFFRKKRL